MKTPFVWLGSGRARKRGVAEATALLDQVARAGLPVPAGAVLLHELYAVLLAEGVIERADTAVQVPDPQWLLEVLYRDVRLPPLAQAVAVRATVESLAFAPLLVPDFTEAKPAAAALSSVWTAQANGAGEARQDVLVYEQVAARQRGTAVLDRAAAVDQIRLLAGEEDKGVFELPHLRRFQRPETGLPAFAQRLQKLARGLRRTLADGTWQVEWADDGAICWVTAVRRAPAQA